MKINIDTKKGKEAFSKVLQKTSDAGKKAVADIQQGAKDFSDKQKQEAYQKRLKKYNPLFPETYKDEKFNLPNIIMIVDDAVRRDIDVCQGAIGWISKINDVEVLCLYDEAVGFSGINFVPVASCDSFYYVDNYNRNRFIDTNCIFNKAHEERLAELQNIANLLGAKRCIIEINETDIERTKDSKKVSTSQSAKFSIPKQGTQDETINVSASVSEGYEYSNSMSNISQRGGKVTAEFTGSDLPERPELKWFSQDDNIKRLIDMRCGRNNSIKSQTLELSGSTSATMSKKAAMSIDLAISNLGGKSKCEMESSATKEHHSKLIFTVEF